MVKYLGSPSSSGAEDNGVKSTLYSSAAFCTTGETFANKIVRIGKTTGGCITTVEGHLLETQNSAIRRDGATRKEPHIFGIPLYHSGLTKYGAQR